MKKDDKSLFELSLEYDRAIDVVSETIRKTLLERKQEMLLGNTDKVIYLNGKLNTLYEEKRDLKIISNHLKSYYDSEHDFDSLFAERAGA